MDAKQDEFAPDSRMVALWRTLIDMERTWKGFSPLPDLNKSLFSVMMCIAHGGKQVPLPQRLKEEQAQEVCAPEVAHAAQRLYKKPVAVGAIATQMHQSLPAASQKISALEELGYVTRMPDPNDRRVTWVELTQLGAAKLCEGRNQFEAKLNAALDAMGDARIQQLLSLLGELNEVLKQTVVPKAPNQKRTKGE